MNNDDTDLTNLFNSITSNTGNFIANDPSSNYLLQKDFHLNNFNSIAPYWDNTDVRKDSHTDGIVYGLNSAISNIERKLENCKQELIDASKDDLGVYRINLEGYKRGLLDSLKGLKDLLNLYTPNENSSDQIFTTNATSNIR